MGWSSFQCRWMHLWFFGSTHWGLTQPRRLFLLLEQLRLKTFAYLRLQSALLSLWGRVLCMHSPYSMLLLLCLTPVSCLVSVHSAGSDSDRCLPACVPACLPACVCSCPVPAQPQPPPPPPPPPPLCRPLIWRLWEIPELKQHSGHGW